MSLLEASLVWEAELWALAASLAGLASVIHYPQGLSGKMFGV